MKIAVDARPLSHPGTGIFRYLTELLKLLVDSPHQWYLYSNDKFEFERADRVKVRTGTGGGKLGSTLFAQTRFPAWAKKDCIDLFWSPRHHLPLRVPAKRKLLTVHDLVWQKYPETMMRMANINERMLMGASVRLADAILTPSVSTASDLIELWPSVRSRVYVTPLGSSLQPYDSGEQTQPACPTILMVGTVEPRKNFARALDAFQMLRAKLGVPVRLVVAGNAGWKSGHLQRRLASSAAEGVDYLGGVSDKRLGRLYASARVVLVPSLYEGFGLPVLEALSFGKPVVVSNRSSLPEVAADAGILVDPTSTEEICDGLWRLLTDENLYAQLQQAARRNALRFSWVKTAEQTLHVIEQLEHG